MRSFALLVAAIVIGVLGGQAFLHQPPQAVRAGDPRILELNLANLVRVEDRDDAKGSRTVHVVAGNVATIIAHVQDIEELMVAVNLSGSDQAGIYSGKPDRRGVVEIEVPLPAAGTQIPVRIPGAPGETALVTIPPGAVFILAPHGAVGWKHPRPWMVVDREWIGAPPLLVAAEEQE